MIDQSVHTNGVIYCATGKEKFLSEAIISVTSLHKYNIFPHSFEISLIFLKCFFITFYINNIVSFS